MNFKMNHIEIIFESSRIVFFIEEQEVTDILYNSEMYYDKSNLNKKNFDALFEVLNQEIKNISKGFVFRPILTMDVKYIDKSNFSEIHKQFFTELGLCLPVRNFELRGVDHAYTSGDDSLKLRTPNPRTDVQHRPE